ncbi:hypothetical protein [Kitasatospora acidiphila]|uniref:hypothetical protein n=1 Tax=Kitasatospora acidiphila TaxID=2567942 RepID=UPI003C748FE1
MSDGFTQFEAEFQQPGWIAGREFSWPAADAEYTAALAAGDDPATMLARTFSLSGEDATRLADVIRTHRKP